MKKTTLFRKYLEDREILLAPIAHDALGGLIAERAGFKCVISAGFANSASLFAKPDVQLLTLNDAVDAAWRLADAVTVPVFGDADNGYGGTTNTARAIRSFEKAGVVGVLLEDQTFPKRCGHMAGKSIVPMEEYLAKIKAAVDARQDSEFTIVARTDALALNGMDEALERLHRAIELGANGAFVEAPRTRDEMRLAASLPVPTLANIHLAGRTPVLPAGELQELGFAIVAYPAVQSMAIAHHLLGVMHDLLKRGDVNDVGDRMLNFDQFTDLIGLPQLRSSEETYARLAQEVAGKLSSVR